jgi:hypothetical protein
MTTTQPQTKAERANAKVATRNGRCVSGTCACEAYEFVSVKDGFATCVCTHTRWAHKDTWVAGRNTVVT